MTDTAPAAASKKSTRSEDVLSFLDDLDKSLPSATSPPSGSSAAAPAGSKGELPPGTTDEEAESALAFLNELAIKKPATPKPVTPTPAPAPAPASVPVQAEAPKLKEKEKEKEAEQPAAGGGWGSWWTAASSQAGAALAQARQVAEGAVPALQAQAPAAGVSAQEWRERLGGLVKGAGLDKIASDLASTSRTALTEILNAVAPPISEHEILQVWLSHDMIGYEGVENVVYNGMAKVMEQVEGGDLVVNKGDEFKPKEGAAAAAGGRDLNAVEGWEEAGKLSEANLSSLISAHDARPPPKPASNPSLPITHTPIFLRLQPVLHTLPLLPGPPSSTPPKSLSFLFTLRDPHHALAYSTATQAVPASWLEDVPEDENEWVEEALVDVIRRGVEVVGTEYVRGRQDGGRRVLKEELEKQGVGKANEEGEKAEKKA